MTVPHEAHVSPGGRNKGVAGPFLSIRNYGSTRVSQSQSAFQMYGVAWIQFYAMAWFHLLKVLFGSKEIVVNC
jgi:hypothetical protein